MGVMITKRLPVTMEKETTIEDVKEIRFEGMCFYFKFNNGKHAKYRFEHVYG